MILGSGKQPIIAIDAAAIIALGEVTMAPRFSCGHPRIAENIARLPEVIGVRCAICHERSQQA